ncbi:acyl-CoA carboxylase subunit beta [Paraglaciecola polaris]|uniref:Geranyl-CoA carboxylase beta subunit n=1 Tax=Paraglaciecola polaris LMG 21857 TaxID=1129793 RepID=K6YQE4_9ALTE|nr:carboxyl transferase domain-containing protein [Paraglaciecola polaris]GAC34959.1 geranyl-CoA carboxylase beta subunit [Paraglaciecola polaris LMG 21857]
MAIFHTQLDHHSEQFTQNAKMMYDCVSEFRAIESRVIQLAEEKAPRYIKRGLIPTRERLSRLLDPGAPFLELSSLCGYMQEGDTDGSAAGGGVIAGIGYVSGARCMVMIDDYLTKGGSITQLGSHKRLRMYQIALQNKLPVIALAQSGGGDLTSLGDWFGFSGAGFAMQAKLSAAGIPQITLVHGSATAGGAYQPGLSDYVVMIKGQSTVYLAGPPLLKAATGEIATDEEIGGAQMHSEVSGVADYQAENDIDGIRIIREITASLGWNDDLDAPRDNQPQEPLYDKDQLLGIVPEEAKTPYDVREVITRIADGSDFLDFKADYDMGTVCGHIKLAGTVCAVIGNNAPITAHGAAKAAQFIHLCQQSGTAIIFLHNTTGFLVGTESERAGIIKHGAKLIQAVTNTTVPKISLVLGGSYGAGNYAMAGRGIEPHFMFAWPRSVVSVMGPAQAGSVLRTVAQAKMARANAIDTDKLDRLEKRTVEVMQAKSGALANSARLWDDGIIDPRDTREILAFALNICREGQGRSVNTSRFGVPRF